MAGYDRVPGYWSDPKLRRESLWKYVDVRDVAEAVLAGLKAPVERSETFNISAADTLMTTETRAVCGGVPGNRDRRRGTLPASRRRSASTRPRNCSAGGRASVGATMWRPTSPTAEYRYPARRGASSVLRPARAGRDAHLPHLAQHVLAGGADMGHRDFGGGGGVAGLDRLDDLGMLGNALAQP